MIGFVWQARHNKRGIKTMDKVTAIRMVNDHLGDVLLNDGNTHFANVNASQARDFWWLNIHPRKFKSELHILLAKKGDNGLVWLRIEVDTFPNPADVFRVRTDDGKLGIVDWEICSDDTDARYMRDIKSGGTKYNFRPHIVQEWD